MKITDYCADYTTRSADGADIAPLVWRTDPGTPDLYIARRAGGTGYVLADHSTSVSVDGRSDVRPIIASWLRDAGLRDYRTHAPMVRWQAVVRHTRPDGMRVVANDCGHAHTTPGGAEECIERRRRRRRNWEAQPWFRAEVVCVGLSGGLLPTTKAEWEHPGVLHVWEEVER